MLGKLVSGIGTFIWDININKLGKLVSIQVSQIEEKCIVYDWTLACFYMYTFQENETNLDNINVALLAKWLINYKNLEISGRWKSIILAKYSHNNFNRSSHSLFGKGIIKCSAMINLGLNKK